MLVALKPLIGNETVELLYTRGREASTQGRCPSAARDLGAVIDRFVSDPRAEFAVNLLLDCYIHEQQFSELEAAVIEMRSNKALVDAHSNLKRPLDRLSLVIERKRVETLEREGDYEGCGRGYLTMTKTGNGLATKHVDELLYNAGHCFEAGRSLGLALKVFEQLVKQFPKSSLSKKAIIRLAGIHGYLANFREAAALYEEYTRKYAGEEDAPESLSLAIAYRRALGDSKKVTLNTLLFVKQYGRKMKREAAEAMFELRREMKRKGRRAFTKHLRSYLKMFGPRGGKWRQLIATVELADETWRCPTDRRGRPLIDSGRRCKGQREAAALLRRAFKLRSRLDEPERLFASYWVERARLLRLEMSHEDARAAGLDTVDFVERFATLGDELTTSWSVVALERAADLTNDKSEQSRLYRRCYERGLKLVLARSKFAACITKSGEGPFLEKSTALLSLPIPAPRHAEIASSKRHDN